MYYLRALVLGCLIASAGGLFMGLGMPLPEEAGFDVYKLSVYRKHRRVFVGLGVAGLVLGIVYGLVGLLIGRF